jgi:hypothetical protein
MSKLLDDDEVARDAPFAGLVRLATWLGCLPKRKALDTDREYRMRVVRSIQRHEKHLRRLPKDKR